MRAAWWSIRLLLAAVLLGTAGSAGAGVTIALEWGECGGGTGGCSATGTDTISVDWGGGQTLRLDIFLSHDLTQGLAAHNFSLRFDSSLENELNLGPMAPTEWVGSDVDPGPFSFQGYGPLTLGVTGTVESGGATEGRIHGFESALIPYDVALPPNGVEYTVGSSTATAPARYRVGQAYFTTNGATADGVDIWAGFFNAPFDFVYDGNDVLIAPGDIAFGTATLNPVPEPGTVSLLGLGVVGLLIAARLGRRP